MMRAIVSLGMLPSVLQPPFRKRAQLHVEHDSDAGIPAPLYQIRRLRRQWRRFRRERSRRYRTSEHFRRRFAEDVGSAPCPKLFDRRVKLEFIAESFNLFNTLNVRFFNTTYGAEDFCPFNPAAAGCVARSTNLEGSPNPAYGTPRAIFNPRQMQFAVRLSF